MFSRNVLVQFHVVSQSGREEGERYYLLPTGGALGPEGLLSPVGPGAHVESSEGFPHRGFLGASALAFPQCILISPKLLELLMLIYHALISGKINFMP